MWIKGENLVNLDMIAEIKVFANRVIARYGDGKESIIASFSNESDAKLLLEKISKLVNAKSVDELIGDFKVYLNLYIKQVGEKYTLRFTVLFADIYSHTLSAIEKSVREKYTRIEDGKYAVGEFDSLDDAVKHAAEILDFVKGIVGNKKIEPTIKFVVNKDVRISEEARDIIRNCGFKLDWNLKNAEA